MAIADLPNVPELELLAQALEFDGPGLRISARVEAYSAKAVRRPESWPWPCF